MKAIAELDTRGLKRNGGFAKPRPRQLRFDAFGILMQSEFMLLDCDAFGAVIRLLAVQWNQPDCAFDLGNPVFLKLARISEEEWAKVRDEVLPLFPPQESLGGKNANPDLLAVCAGRPLGFEYY